MVAAAHASAHGPQPRRHYPTCTNRINPGELEKVGVLSIHYGATDPTVPHSRGAAAAHRADPSSKVALRARRAGSPVEAWYRRHVGRLLLALSSPIHVKNALRCRLPIFAVAAAGATAL